MSNDRWLAEISKTLRTSGGLC